MTPALDPALREALAERIRFYREIGLTEFYRREVDSSAGVNAVVESSSAAAIAEVRSADTNVEAAGASAMTQSQIVENTAKAQSEAPDAQAVRQNDIFAEETAIPARKGFHPQPEIAQIVPPSRRAAALEEIREEIGDCRRCPLHAGRNQLVFGDGDSNARLLFVGEGPGADEDAQGLPFVGRAGQLLNNMIAAMGLRREQVYICNVVKCRPPGNRTPEPEEANTCSPFLFRQIDVVRPQVIVALGATAATCLLGTRQPLAGLRGRVHAVRGTQLIVTYHPAYLLRDPRQKKEAWADLQIAMKELGLKPPAKH